MADQPVTPDTTTTHPAFPTSWARAQFPSFADPELADWAHLENAGGSWMCQQALDLLSTYHRRRVQGYTHFPAGAANADLMAAGRAAMCRHLGVDDEDLFVGPSTTSLTYVLGRAFGDVLGPGDAIVVTDQDHEANNGPWRRLADRGVEVREWHVDPVTGHLAVADLERLLDDDVAVVSFPHASNVVGEVNDVVRIAALARAAGAISVVDGVAHAPHGLPDVPSLGCDVYVFSAYKTFGPHQGVMTVAAPVRDRLPNQGHFFNASLPGKQFTPAGPDHAQLAALAGVAAYFDALADQLGAEDRAATIAAIRRRETDLLRPLLDTLRDRPGVRILGPHDPDRRVPTVTLATATPGPELAARMAEHRVMAAGGHFYAHRLLDALGVGADHGGLRLSFLHTTADWEVDRAIAALDDVLP